ncbi:hypothetical protein HMPREF1990_01896 [Porphyromonas gingivalis W4087]|nr:hypothetical protein HMPREF1990_01896 [Porphyromonas gingivalis W4087]
MDPERKGKGYEVSCETSRWRPCRGCNRLFVSLLQMQIGGGKMPLFGISTAATGLSSVVRI